MIILFLQEIAPPLETGKVLIQMLIGFLVGVQTVYQTVVKMCRCKTQTALRLIQLILKMALAQQNKQTAGCQARMAQAHL